MQQDNDPSPPPPHKYFFTYLYIDTNTDHVVLLFPFILYFIICCSCFHRSNPFLLFCGGAGETFGRSLSMFALSSPHDLDEMTFLFRQIWEKTNRGHRSDSPPRPSHQHEAVSCQASTKLTTVRPKPAWKSSFLRTIRSSRRAQTQHKSLSLKRERRETAWRLYREKMILSLHHLSFSFTSRLCGKWKAPSISHLKTSRGKLLHQDKRSVFQTHNRYFAVFCMRELFLTFSLFVCCCFWFSATSI